MVDIWAGIDPGLDGGIGLVDETGQLVHVVRMPTLTLPKSDGSTRRIVDGAALTAFLRTWAPGRVWIEDVYSSPQMGVVGAFTMGEGKGVLRGVLGALGLEPEWVVPQVWKGRMGVLVPRRPGDSKVVHRKRLKAAAIAKAKLLYPGNDKALTHDGQAEAALIAGYGLVLDRRFPARVAGTRATA